MNLIQNLYGLFFDSKTRPDLEQEATEPAKEISSMSPTAQVVMEPSEYADDIMNLEAAFGKLSTGLCIETTLQELVKVVPRKRVRIDAYKKLQDYLQNEYGVLLTIKSRKTH